MALDSRQERRLVVGTDIASLQEGPAFGRRVEEGFRGEEGVTHPCDGKLGLHVQARAKAIPFFACVSYLHISSLARYGYIDTSIESYRSRCSWSHPDSWFSFVSVNFISALYWQTPLIASSIISPALITSTQPPGTCFCCSPCADTCGQFHLSNLNIEGTLNRIEWAHVQNNSYSCPVILYFISQSIQIGCSVVFLWSAGEPPGRG